MKQTYFFYPGNDDVFFDALADINNSQFREKGIIVRKQIYVKGQNKIDRIKNKITWKTNIFFILNCINMFFSPFLKIKKDLKVRGEKIFVFSNLTIKMLPIQLIKKINLRRDCKIVVYLIDNSDNPLCKEAIYLCNKFHFDSVYTFNSKDAEKYNFKHIYYIYSKLPFKAKSGHKPKRQIVFFGSNKGRFPIFLKILKALQKKQISFFFSLIGINSDEKKKLAIYPNVEINNPISYKALVKKIQDYNVLLDIVATKEAGLSYRPIEAICYNKKLLTNNKKILDFPYYDPEYMKYFEKVEDIDWNFVQENKPVDYKYNNDYSPVEFLKKIQKEINKK